MMTDAMLRILWRLLRSCAIGMCISLSCLSISLAGVDVCQQPTAFSHLSIAYYNHEESAIERSIGETNQENYNFDLQFELNENWAFGVGHRYVILNIDPIELQTNGHLHTFFLPLHKQSQSDGQSFRFSIAPALSASSNVMKDPSEYSADALQLLAALVWSRKLSERATFRYGICGDHRFGNYEVYPLISVDWQPHADWVIELGFPTTRLTYQVSRNITSSLRIAPDGNEWYVKTKSLEKRSRVIYEASLVEWAFNWQAQKHFAITASIGRQFHNRYAVTLQDESQVRLSSDSVTRIGAALEWRF
jgi:hypothetical protein